MFSLGRAADVKQRPQLAGDLTPPREVYLEGASAALRFKGQMWQHLKVCHKLHLQKNHSTHPVGGWQSGLVIWVRGCRALGGGNILPNSLMFTGQLGRGEAEVWISKMLPSLGVSFKENRAGLISGEIASEERLNCVVLDMLLNDLEKQGDEEETKSVE